MSDRGDLTPRNLGLRLQKAAQSLQPEVARSNQAAGGRSIIQAGNRSGVVAVQGCDGGQDIVMIPDANGQYYAVGNERETTKEYTLYSRHVRPKQQSKKDEYACAVLFRKFNPTLPGFEELWVGGDRSPQKIRDYFAGWDYIVQPEFYWFGPGPGTILSGYDLDENYWFFTQSQRIVDDLAWTQNRRWYEVLFHLDFQVFEATQATVEIQIIHNEKIGDNTFHTLSAEAITEPFFTPGTEPPWSSYYVSGSYTARSSPGVSTRTFNLVPGYHEIFGYNFIQMGRTVATDPRGCVGYWEIYTRFPGDSGFPRIYSTRRFPNPNNTYTLDDPYFDAGAGVFRSTYDNRDMQAYELFGSGGFPSGTYIQSKTFYPDSPTCRPFGSPPDTLDFEIRVKVSFTGNKPVYPISRFTYFSAKNKSKLFVGREYSPHSATDAPPLDGGYSLNMAYWKKFDYIKVEGADTTIDVNVQPFDTNKRVFNDNNDWFFFPVTATFGVNQGPVFTPPTDPDDWRNGRATFEFKDYYPLSRGSGWESRIVPNRGSIFKSPPDVIAKYQPHIANIKVNIIDAKHLEITAPTDDPDFNNLLTGDRELDLKVSAIAEDGSISGTKTMKVKTKGFGLAPETASLAKVIGLAAFPKK